MRGIRHPKTKEYFMIAQHPPKPLLKPTSFCFIFFLALLFLAVHKGAEAAEPLSSGRQAHGEQGASPVRNPEQRIDPKPQAEIGSGPKPAEKDDWKFNLGAGVMYKPAFLGSKDYQAMAFPDIKVEYKDSFFASLFEGVGYNAINSDGWRAGPILKFDFGRSEDDDSPFRIAGKKTSALQGLGDVDAALELGGFVEYKFGSFSSALELRQGVGGHEGLVGETSLKYKGFTKQFGKSIMYAFGPRATFADSNYNNAYFGITQSQSSKSGLATFDADSGLVSYGVSAFAVMSITESISMGVFSGYDRLADTVADSPLIKERGSENQFMGGLRFRYEFGY
jgi:outer membrane protein